MCRGHKRQTEGGDGEDGTLGINKMKGDIGSCLSDGSKSGAGIGPEENGKGKWSLFCLEIIEQRQRKKCQGQMPNSIHGLRRSCTVWS